MKISDPTSAYSRMQSRNKDMNTKQYNDRF